MRDISTCEGLAAFNMIGNLGHTYDHSGNLEPVLGASDLACSATQLCVDLHGNVGAVLRLSLDNMSNIEA
jgi:hypothetical protein